MSAPNLKLIKVNTDTGELIGEEPCIHCGRTDHPILLRDLENAEHELRRLRRKLKKLEADKDAEREADPQKSEIQHLFRHWQLSAGKSKSKLTADRFDAIRAALKAGYTVEQLEWAIEGIVAFPFVVNGQRSPQGAPANRHDDVTLACTVGKRIEKLANLGYQERRRNG
jgi:hypothetical protein